MKVAKSKWTLFVATSPTFSWIFFQTNFISPSSYAYLWAPQATDPICAPLLNTSQHISLVKSCCLPLFDVSLLWFQLFEAIGEGRSPLCTESTIPLRSQGCAHTPALCWTRATLGHISNLPQDFLQFLDWKSFFSCKANHFLSWRTLGKHFGKNTKENFISQKAGKARRRDSTETTQQPHDRGGTRVPPSQTLAWHWLMLRSSGKQVLS